ncbi:MAG: hypothetical protein JSS22_06180 [Proteobacteria bacterium]|nr:hypothetical protein [Pseudomonadota bacterium]
MIKLSFLPAPLDWSNVAIKVDNLTVPSSRLTLDGKFVDTSVSFLDPEGKVSAAIVANAKITVGQISFENLDRRDWSFGFAQALKARECVVEYAGVRSNAGSVVVTAFDTRDNEPVFTDSHQSDPIEARPWSKPAALRFTYFRSRGVIELDTGDAPGIRVPALIGNRATNADNFLSRISDKREICCALAVEDTRNFSEPQVLGHSLWTIDLSFSFTWTGKGKQLVPKFTGSISPGQFTEGLPADAGYRKMFDKSFISGDPYNTRASELLNRHLRAQKSDRKDERDTRLPSVPSNFFV